MVTLRIRMAETDEQLLHDAWRRSTDATPNALAHRILMHGVRKQLAMPTPEEEALFEAAQARAREWAQKGEKGSPNESS